MLIPMLSADAYQNRPFVRVSNASLSPASFGVARYSADLLAGLQNSTIDAESGLLITKRGAWYNSLDSLSYRFELNYPKQLNRIFLALNRSHERRDLANRPYNLLHETYYSQAPNKPNAIKVVATVFDMIHQLFPEQFSRKDRAAVYKYHTLLRADKLICISENTREDLLAIWPEFEEKARVVPLGISNRFLDQPLDRSRARQGEILFVGSRNGYKNFWTLAETVGYLIRVQPSIDWRLRVFGGSKWSNSEFRKINSLGIPPERLEISRGPEKLLINSYKSASVLVYPSKYEGFGYPPLEALALGCPVIASNTSSIPEVVGNFGILLDQVSIDSLADALTGVMGAHAPTHAFLEQGRKRARAFSSQKMALETAKVYNEVLAE